MVVDRKDYEEHFIGELRKDEKPLQSNPTGENRKIPKTFDCTHAGCGKLFDTDGKLKAHAKSHLKAWIECPVDDCDKSYSQSNSMYKHYAVVLRDNAETSDTYIKHKFYSDKRPPSKQSGNKYRSGQVIAKRSMPPPAKPTKKQNTKPE